MIEAQTSLRYHINMTQYTRVILPYSTAVQPQSMTLLQYDVAPEEQSLVAMVYDISGVFLTQNSILNAFYAVVADGVSGDSITRKNDGD